MLLPRRRALASLRALLQSGSAAELSARLAPRPAHTNDTRPATRAAHTDSPAARWAAIARDGTPNPELFDTVSEIAEPTYARNIENYIGTVKVPVGVVGPLRVNGAHAHGDYVVPLATTEAALVASYNRGARVVTEAGGCSTVTTSECVSRAPAFAFVTLAEAGAFIAWVLDTLPELRRVAEATTRHGKLLDLRVSLEGNHVYLVFDYSTGDASGQNMVTIATHAAYAFILAQSPVVPTWSVLEANHSGDKKASAQSFATGRGRSVSAEVQVPRELVARRLHTTPEALARYFSMSAIGGVLSGTIGVQGHYANGLAAVFLATGQDVACVAEAAVGITRLEVQQGDLYAAVTLPNLVVGTIGGGTGLPSQRAALELMGLHGAGHANAFAEVCAGLALAGELSITSALCAGEFSQAHERMARHA